MKLKISVFVLMSLFIVGLVSAATVFGEDSQGVLIEDLGAGISHVDFVEGNSILTVLEGDVGSPVKTIYTNIQPASNNIRASIYFLSFGVISKMDITASNDTQIYVNGLEVDLKKNFRLFFEGDELKVFSPDGEFSLDSLPVSLNSNLPGFPKTITYNAALGNVKLPNGYELNEGIVKYSFEDKDYYVPLGEKASLNGYNINAGKIDVILGDNFEMKGDTVYLDGDGFDVFFDPINSPSKSISLKESKNTKYFYLGDKGDSVKEIQKIVGLDPTGEYDIVTVKFVEKWQEDHGLVSDGKFGGNSLLKSNKDFSVDLENSRNGDYYMVGDSGEDVKQIQSRLISEGYLPSHTSNGKSNADGSFGGLTKTALENWQRDNGLVSDGLFGGNSKELMSVGEGKIGVYMKGGGAKIIQGKDLLEIELEGKSNLKISNKLYTFDGENVNQKLSSSLSSTAVDVPTKITFDTGFFSEEVFELEPNVRQIKETGEVGIIELRDFSVRQGIDTSKSQCASFVTYACPLLLEGSGGGINLESLSQDEFQNFVNSQGVYGSAWEMQGNMIRKGGDVLYTKTNYLSQEDYSKLNSLKEDLKKDYAVFEERGLTEDQIYEALSDKYRKNFLDIYHDNEVQEAVPALKGDVVSMYFKNSNYLSKALLEGNNDQANTHIGIVQDSIQTIVRLGGKGSVESQLESALNINKEGLAVNSYSYLNSEGVVEVINYVGGNFVSYSGNQIPLDAEIVVTRPQLAHMIHYTKGEADPFHLENLDEVLSRDAFSLFGVTRPKSSEYSGSFVQSPDVFDSRIRGVDCGGVSCVDVNLEDSLKINGVENYISLADTLKKSTLERQKEFGIPNQQLDEFVSLTNAIIKRESNFGDSENYKMKNTFSWFTSSAGLMQISDDAIEDYMGMFSDEDPKDEGDYIKYGQRRLAEIFREYAPKDRQLTKEDVQYIAAAYNSGTYTPRITGMQQKLRALGYIDYTVKATGTKGPATNAGLNKFAKDYGLEGDFSKLGASKLPTSEIYKKIDEIYKITFGEEPPSAGVPEIETSDIRGTRSVQGYADGVYKNYKKFCLVCPKEEPVQYADSTPLEY